MPHVADQSFIDDLFGEEDGWDAAVVVAHHVEDARALDRIEHALRLRDGVGQGLLAQHDLARFGRGNRDLRMRVARRADVDDVHVVARDRGAPVGFRVLPAESARRVVEPVARAASDDAQARCDARRKERAHLTPRVAVRASHERVADHRNADLACAHPFFTPRWW
jgi:hypothetical protein